MTSRNTNTTLNGTRPLDLIRDAFTEGLVAGAADIRSKAAEHPDGASPTG